MTFIHVKAKARILVEALAGKSLEEIAAVEHVAPAVVADFVRSAGWPDKGKVGKWAAYYSRQAGDITPPSPTKDDPDDTVTVTCEGCGDSFETPATGNQRRYCSKSCNNRAVYRRSQERAGIAPSSPVTCAHCGEQFRRKSPVQKYCHPHCRAAAKRKANRIEPRPATTTCAWCEKEFEVPQFGKIPTYCSDGHREMASRKRRAEAEIEHDVDQTDPEHAVVLGDAPTALADHGDDFVEHTAVEVGEDQADEADEGEDEDPDAPPESAGARVLYDTRPDTVDDDSDTTDTDDTDEEAAQVTAAEDTAVDDAPPPPITGVVTGDDDVFTQWPVLADVPSLIRRAWHLEHDTTSAAVVTLLNAATALRDAVIQTEALAAQEAARAEEIDRLQRAETRLCEELAEVRTALANLTVPDTATSAAALGHVDIPKPCPPPSAPAPAPQGQVEEVGVLMIPPTRKGGQWGCGEPGCRRKFPTQRGVLTHAHRVHRQQHQEAS